MVSPLTIRIMIECATCADPGANMPERMWNSTASKEAREELEAMDLIDDTNQATPRGRAWLDFICATPLPVQTWTLPPRALPPVGGTDG